MPSKLLQFEEFRIKVIAALEEWELKAEGLAALSQRYEAELEEQKKIYNQMK